MLKVLFVLVEKVGETTKPTGNLSPKIVSNTPNNKQESNTKTFVDKNSNIYVDVATILYHYVPSTTYPSNEECLLQALR